MTIKQLAKELNVKVAELKNIDVVHVREGSQEHAVDVQACIKECSDYQRFKKSLIKD